MDTVWVHGFYRHCEFALVNTLVRACQGVNDRQSLVLHYWCAFVVCIFSCVLVFSYSSYSCSHIRVLTFVFSHSCSHIRVLIFVCVCACACCSREERVSPAGSSSDEERHAHHAHHVHDHHHHVPSLWTEWGTPPRLDRGWSREASWDALQEFCDTYELHHGDVASIMRKVLMRRNDRLSIRHLSEAT